MKRFAAMIASFLFPGIGHFFYGHFVWALIFIGSTCLFGPMANVLAALHVVFFVD